jgi:hypothetical protein
LGDSDDKVNAAGFSDSTVDKTVDGITYDVYTHSDALNNKRICICLTLIESAQNLTTQWL